MASAPLTATRGINRLKTKGGVRADWLYDLLNGYVTEEQQVHVRPGSERTTTLPEETAGLMVHEGEFWVFSTEVVEVPAGYNLAVIAHPDSTTDEPIALTKIHFAKPFMGFPYVAAEFENGDTFHFWLRSKGAWQAETIYHAGDIVEPTTPTGLAFQATRNGSPLPSWSAGTPRTTGDQIEPTEYNDFFYEVVDTIGDSPASGTEEPIWPTEEGAQVIEDTEGVESGSTTVTSPPTAQLPSDVQDRYQVE